MKMHTVKAAVSAAAAALAVYFGKLAVPLAVLLAVMVTDYATGMVRAYLGRELSSKKGLAGILKKLCYFIVVGVGAGADWLLSVAAETFSFSLSFPFSVALTVAVWLIINELISILENLAGIGVPLPAFLGRLIGRLKVSVEQTDGTQPQ